MTTRDVEAIASAVARCYLADDPTAISCSEYFWDKLPERCHIDCQESKDNNRFVCGR